MCHYYLYQYSVLMAARLHTFTAARLYTFTALSSIEAFAIPNRFQVYEAAVI